MIVTKAEPKYRQVVLHFEREIAEGGIKAGDRIPSTRELATLFDLNPETVQTGLKILADRGMIERRPKCGSFVRAVGASKTIGLVFGRQNYGSLDMAFFNMLLDHLSEMLLTAGWSIKNYATTRCEEFDTTFHELERDVSAGSLKAVVELCTSKMVQGWVEKICRVPALSCPIAIDYADFIHTGIAHLVALGRTRPVLVFDRDHTPAPLIRAALKAEAKLFSLSEIKAVHSEPSQRYGYDVAKKLFESGERFDSLLVLYDNTFRGILYYLLEKGLRIPEDVALISHANKGIDIMCHLPLTRLEFDPCDFARQAFEKLTAKLEGLRFTVRDIQPNLIIGKTCGE